MGGHALRRSFPARAGAALVALTAMAVAVAAAKIELAKPDQVADAQAQIKANGLNCEVGKVRFGGEGDMKNKDKKSVHVQVYEVTCANGFGYLVEGPKGGSADTVVSSCPALAASGKKGDNSNSCQLPENQDVKAQTQAILSKAGVSCTVQNTKWIGINPKDRSEGFEVACAAPSPGYILFVPQTAGAEPHATNCMLQSYKCALTSPEQQTAWVKSLAAQSGRSCDVTKSRYVGTDTKDNTSFFEVGCAKGAGFMFAVNAAGAFKEAIGCADAANLGGGCTLTDKALIQASGAESWGEKLKAAGVACNVQQARLIGQMSGKRDVVEYQCSDRPAGLIVGLPNQAGQKPDVVDCFDAPPLRHQVPAHLGGRPEPDPGQGSERVRQELRGVGLPEPRRLRERHERLRDRLRIGARLHRGPAGRLQQGEPGADLRGSRQDGEPHRPVLLASGQHLKPDGFTRLSA